jgi:hypothetical protein
MKGTLGYDPETKDYGPASVAIRALIHLYAHIDWFEPWGDLHAAQHELERHQRLARAHLPELFPELQVQLVEGTWVEFGEYCATVRNPDRRWDWRMGPLKQLSAAHARAHGWRLEDQPARMPPEPGDLFLRVGTTTVWWDAAAHLELDREQASWYASYARGDLYDAIQWWLADPGALDNPFLPLIRCYQAGVYPFSLSQDHVVLFAFRAAPAKLPTARVVR